MSQHDRPDDPDAHALWSLDSDPAAQLSFLDAPPRHVSEAAPVRDEHVLAPVSHAPQAVPMPATLESLYEMLSTGALDRTHAASLAVALLDYIAQYSPLPVAQQSGARMIFIFICDTH